MRLQVTGHAGAGEAGEDLVCAGVSALCETLALGLRRYDPEASTALGEGSLRYRGEPDDRALALLDTFFMGLEDLAQTHASHVRAVREGWR